MSWFGGGGGGKSERNESTYRPDSYQQDQSFVEQQESYVAPGGGGGISESFQQALVLEQQNALIQAVIFKLSDIAVKKCITSPSTSLSSSK
jgi:Tim10/DDP family zinc finger